MTNNETIKKMILKAKENGFNTDIQINNQTELNSIMYPYNDNENMFSVMYEDESCELWTLRDIIFSHEFAKAFFGEETIDHMISDDDMIMGDFGEEWEYHLQQMVLEDEPLKYLENFLNKE